MDCHLTGQPAASVQDGPARHPPDNPFRPPSRVELHIDRFDGTALRYERHSPKQAARRDKPRARAFLLALFFLFGLDAKKIHLNLSNVPPVTKIKISTVCDVGL